nr:MAG TPA: hypothetical protein [Caudoviricetes sp.]
MPLLLQFCCNPSPIFHLQKIQTHVRWRFHRCLPL